MSGVGSVAVGEGDAATVEGMGEPGAAVPGVPVAEVLGSIAVGEHAANVNTTIEGRTR